MRILVTGGAGFIGSQFVRLTLHDHPGDCVVVLDKFTYAGNRRNLEDAGDLARLRVIEGDVAIRDDVKTALRGCDAVVNFAAETHVDRSLEDADSFLRTDVVGALVLLEAARGAGVERFVQVSTDEVYGDVLTGRSREDDPLRPRSPYSASKAGAEMLVWAYRASHGYPAMVTRGSNTYGHHQFPEKIIPLFVVNALEGLPLPLYGDGSAARDYIHVDDHARGIDTVLRHGMPATDYNIGQEGEEITGRDVAAAVLRLTGAPGSLLTHVLDRQGHDRRYALDCSRLRSLGWSPRHTFETGLADTVDWYRGNRGWWAPLRDGAYWDFYRRNYRLATGNPGD